MASSRIGLEPPGRPEPGGILIVIHDFSARSSDELSLAKGDRVELIERDDEFGDGWYLGKHLTNGNTGLFPEVYTRPAPRGQIAYGNTRPTPAPATAVTPAPASAPIQQTTISAPPSTAGSFSSKLDPSSATTEVDRHVSVASAPISSPVTSPLQPSPPIMGSISAPGSAKFPNSLNSAISGTGLAATAKDSPVMNETLSVINEHITDLKSPRQNGQLRAGSINDSSSEYSSHIGHRMSYINGEETDEEEEEEHQHEMEEVTRWTPDQVAEYLESVGVEPKHCEVFRDQDISGDVLLEMEQTSLFLKEFELGSVGRRLKTWQKIKALQDECRGLTPPATRRTTQEFMDYEFDDDSRRSRSNTVTKDRRDSRHKARNSQQSMRADTTPGTPPGGFGSPRNITEPRHSTASLRELNHSSRRNSSYDFTNSHRVPSITEGVAAETLGTTHQKHPSFDKNWTMSAPRSPPPVPRPNSSAGKPKSPRPLSSAGIKDFIGNSFEALTSTSPQLDLDRGYFSGGEADGRKRNVLRKKSNLSHSRNSSIADGARATSHTRFGSVDSSNNGAPSASQRYYGIGPRKRAPSAASAASAEVKPMVPAKDFKDSSPAVTKLDGVNASLRVRSGKPSDWLLPLRASVDKARNNRANSDTATNDKTRTVDPIASIKESPMTSPARTASSTPSGGGTSFEMESPGMLKSPPVGPMPSQKAPRKKSKKETSAYTRGLEKKTPQEQMVGCDYSGWMKKKNTNLMTTWKPRLFVLRGRRLSYYYSENDEQERGLIDISGHRVLPAESDRITGLHATLTGATKSPPIPADAQTVTIAETEAAAEVESSLTKSPGDQMFIFKLVPPRAGQTRAVNFTKPTVHYFALPNVKQGRLWMAALMKATIDRDDTKAVTSTYQQKTISLAKARAMRHRPPALMNNLDEKVADTNLDVTIPMNELRGLNINGIIFDQDIKEDDSGVSGVNVNGSSKDLGSMDSKRNENPYAFDSAATSVVGDEKSKDITP